MQLGSKDPEKSAQLPSSKLVDHKGHCDIPRWHHTLHPSAVKECARNAFPTRLGHVFHPTHATLAMEDGTTWNWFSRWHRKNLYKRPPTRLRSFWIGLSNVRRLEYWNVSWWVAIVRVLAFSLNSAVHLFYFASFVSSGLLWAV